MTTAPADTVADPARAPGPRPRLKRRLAASVAAGALAAVALFLVWSYAGSMTSAGFGPVVRFHVMHSWDSVIPFLHLPRRVPWQYTSAMPANSVWLAVPPEPGVRFGNDDVQPWIAARCGCRYEKTYVTHTTKWPTIYHWSCWPRDEPVVRVQWGPAESPERIELVNPFPLTPAAAAERPLSSLPWEGEIGGAHMTLREEPGDGATAKITFSIENVRGSAAPVRVFRDAKGNTHTMQAVTHGMPIPFGKGLCPHCAWWEMEVRPPGGEAVTLRFAPPR